MSRSPAMINIPDDLRRLAGVRAGVMTVTELRRSGLDASAVRSLARAGRITQVLRGAYCLGTSPGPRQRAIAAALICHPEAVVSHESAALLLGWRDPRPGELTHLWLPAGATRGQERDGVRLHWTNLPPEAITRVEGVRVTDQWRVAQDLLRFRDRAAAVALIDQGLHRGCLTSHQLSEVAQTVPILRRSWAELTDGRAESPLESRVRLILQDAGLSPDLQVDVFFPDRRHAGRVDLGWPRWRVGIECDGRVPHTAAPALFRDRTRHDDLSSLGWHLVRVTWEMLRTPGEIVRRVRRALELREFARAV